MKETTITIYIDQTIKKSSYLMCLQKFLWESEREVSRDT